MEEGNIWVPWGRMPVWNDINCSLISILLKKLDLSKWSATLLLLCPAPTCWIWVELWLCHSLYKIFLCLSINNWDLYKHLSGTTLKCFLTPAKLEYSSLSLSICFFFIRWLLVRIFFNLCLFTSYSSFVSHLRCDAYSWVPFWSTSSLLEYTWSLPPLFFQCILFLSLMAFIGFCFAFNFVGSYYILSASTVSTLLETDFIFLIFMPQ